MAHLMRLVMDERPMAAAARRLREVVPDDAVLRRVRARLSRTMLDRSGAIGERAVATIDAAMALGRRRRGGAASEAGSPSGRVEPPSSPPA